MTSAAQIASNATVLIVLCILAFAIALALSFGRHNGRH